jgi:tRNA threonylcarbamoyladenosine biosynthesis protein TsaB
MQAVNPRSHAAAPEGSPRPPLFLALDCTGDSFSLAVANATVTLAEWCGGRPREHLTQLFETLHQMLGRAGIKPNELSAIAVTVGPGSFTGVRLGVLIARTFAQVLRVPVYPVDALAALACNAVECERLVVAIDARKSQVMAAEFRVQQGVAQVQAPARLWEPEEWAAQLAQGCTVLGNAIPTYCHLLSRVNVLPADLALVRASAVARLAFGMAQGVEWSALLPDYTRPASVQVQSA